MSHKKFELGQEFLTSYLISNSTMDSFGDLSKDFNPIHIDDRYAKDRGFKSRVSYGNILGLLISALVGETLKDYNVMLISQNINFNKPIYIGTRVLLSARVDTINDVYKITKLKLYFKDELGIKYASGNCMVKEI